jgi:ankyrin repeat protein
VNRFHEAVVRGDVARVEELLAEDPGRLDRPGEDKRTALHYAAEHDRREVAELLLDRGADPERETAWGDTPLQWAGALGSIEVGALLLDRGLEAQLNLPVAAGLGLLERVRLMVDAKDPPGRIPPAGEPDDHWPADAALHTGDVLGDAFVLACRNGHPEVARYLLDEGADLEAKGVFGGTALQWAAIQGHEETALWLVEEGADRTRRDPVFDADAAGWAREGGHDELAARLAGGR